MCPDDLIKPEHDIWENGVPLSEAAYVFAPENLLGERDEFVRLKPQNTDDPIDVTLTDLANKVRRWSKSKTAQLDFLLQSLRSGELVAFGYTAPRQVTDKRGKIPNDLFERHYIDWANSSIKGALLEFSSVLVFEPELAQEIDAQLAKKAPAQGTGIKRGPPPSSGAIEEAIRSLLDEGWQSQNYLQKENIVTIRARVHKLHPGKFPNDRDLSKESIRVVLAKLIPIEKK